MAVSTASASSWAVAAAVSNLVKQVRAVQKQLQVRRQPVLQERLEGLAASVLGEMRTVAAVLVVAFPVFPGHRRVVGELIEPSAHLS